MQLTHRYGSIGRQRKRKSGSWNQDKWKNVAYDGWNLNTVQLKEFSGRRKLQHDAGTKLLTHLAKSKHKIFEFRGTTVTIDSHNLVKTCSVPSTILSSLHE